MRKLLFVLPLLGLLSCSKNNCATFNKDNYAEVITEVGKNESFTKPEKAMLAGYFMQYAMINAMAKNGADNPFAVGMLKAAQESGYKELTNTCDVLDHMRALLKKQGKTEEQFASEMEEFSKTDFSKMGN